MGHGQAEDPQTPYAGALELQDIYASIGVYKELKTLVMPDGVDSWSRRMGRRG